MTILDPEHISPADRIIILFDADILVYRAGFAAEKRQYTIPRPDGELQHAPSKKAAVNIAAQLGVPESDITWERVAEPVENATHNLHKIVRSTVKSLEGIYGTLSSDVICVLTGCDIEPNFREEVCFDYKNNRDPAHKPTHYSALRNEIQQEYPTILTQGAEADDYLGPGRNEVLSKYSRENVEVIIASIDKDLLATPGIHYNFVKHTLREISEAEANLNFFVQTLVGDKADNIRGVRGVGEVGARKLLRAYMHDHAKMKELCTNLYKKAYGEHWERQWNINCHLLYIWRAMPDVCPFTV